MVKAGRWLRSLLGGRKESAPKDKTSEQGKGGNSSSRSRRRWSFGRSKTRNAASLPAPPEVKSLNGAGSAGGGGGRGADQIKGGGEGGDEYASKMEGDGGSNNKHAMAVAVATAAAAEAAVAAAQAAAAVVRLTSNGRTLFNGATPTTPTSTTRSREEEWAAATRIQAAFRAYLARRALRALKGLVKLQALVRGHIVRKQAAITLRCMQALVRVQARVRSRRVRNSDEGQAVQRQLQQRRCQQESRPRRSMDRWSTPDLEFKPGPGSKRGAVSGYSNSHSNGSSSNLNNSLKTRGPATTNGFTDQHHNRKTPPNSMAVDCEPDKQHWSWTWLDRWMAARPWESPLFDELMMQADGDDCPAKIVEMDTGRPRRRNGSMSEAGSIEPMSMASTPPASAALAANSPFAPARRNLTPPAPGGRHAIPSPASETAENDAAAGEGMTNLSPGEYSLRVIHDEESVLSTAQSSPRFSGRRSAYGGPYGEYGDYDDRYSENFGGFPNYMATTKSAKAKVRSQSAPKQRPADPLMLEKAPSGKAKRLSLHDGSGNGGRMGGFSSAAAAAAARMQRSSSQQARSVVGGKGMFQPIRLDRSSVSLRDGDTSSVNGDLRRAFK